MLKNSIQIIVIVLGVLIFIAFLALIYGMYLKISISGKKLIIKPAVFSAHLENNEKIEDIEVIDKDKLLILIKGPDNTKGAIYDINHHQIISFIER
jgi:hypothetical protein